MSKYRFFSGPYFPTFGPNKIPYLDTLHTVQKRDTIDNTGFMERAFIVNKYNVEKWYFWAKWFYRNETLSVNPSRPYSGRREKI